MARAIWKGAISFGLVHIPVGLISATASQRVDFDWLDKRSMDPVEVRDLADTLELDESVTKAELNKRERDMAKRLVKDMSIDWKADDYHDTFQDKIMKLVESKARDGKLQTVSGDEEKVERQRADVIDLTDLLRRSLAGKGGGGKRTAGKKACSDRPEKKRKAS